MAGTFAADAKWDQKQVGNEFSSVEALWSQFENVMAKEEEQGQGRGAETQQQQDEDDERAEGRNS